MGYSQNIKANTGFFKIFDMEFEVYGEDYINMDLLDKSIPEEVSHEDAKINDKKVVIKIMTFSISRGIEQARKIADSIKLSYESQSKYARLQYRILEY